MAKIFSRQKFPTIQYIIIAHYVHAHTKVFLGPSPVEVDPNLPWSIVAYTRVLLIMETIKSSTHSIVQLKTKYRILRMQAK